MKERVSFMINLLGCGLISASLILGAGCTTTGGGNDVGGEGPAAAKSGGGDEKPKLAAGVAVVESVDDLNFVILKTSTKVKAKNKKAYDVYRGKEVVGKVKLDGTQQGDFVSADIVEGEIKPGDTVRLK